MHQRAEKADSRGLGRVTQLCTGLVLVGVLGEGGPCIVTGLDPVIGTLATCFLTGLRVAYVSRIQDNLSLFG